MIRAIVSIFAVTIACIAMTGCPGPLETAVRTANAMTQFGDGVADMVRDIYVTSLKQAVEESVTEEELNDRIAGINARFRPVERAYNSYRLALVALRQAIVLAQESAAPPSDDEFYSLVGKLLDAKRELGVAMQEAGLDPGDISRVIPLGEN